MNSEYLISAKRRYGEISIMDSLRNPKIPAPYKSAFKVSGQVQVNRDNSLNRGDAIEIAHF